MRVTTARLVAVLIMLMARATYAAHFSVGAELYEKGDYEGALEQWQVLSKQGDLRAQYRLGQMFAEGVGVPKDDRVALHWFRQAAEQGSVEARYELALLYSVGRGVPKDHARAAHWYGLLAEDGHLTAQYLLARRYEQGAGGAQDLARAVHWYERAAGQGHLRAQVKLGEMYSRGGAIEEDLVRAWMWFDLAAVRGHELAARERERLELFLSEQDLARAMRLSGVRSLPLSVRQVEAVPPPRPEPRPPPTPAPDMVRISEGCFAMGSSPSEVGRHENESRHPVCVEEFSISRHEVTRGQYASFVSETGRRTPDTCHTYRDGGWRSRAGRSWRNPGYAQSDDHPVTCVSRDDALAFAKWLSKRRGTSYRLPTEAEWEYAARAGSGAARYWGEDAERACTWGNVGDRSLLRHYRDWSWQAHSCDDGHVHTAPVGSFRVNLYGLHDMAGNVWEWTCSSSDPAYRGAERLCASGDRSGVVRGGSWSNSPRWVRAAARFDNQADARFDIVGFRLAHD